MENTNLIDKAREMARLCLDCIYGNITRPEHGAARGSAYECVKNFPVADCPFWGIYQVELQARAGQATACA